MPSGPFESDLRATREARGLSLDQIQQQTRIPVDVLRRFESGDLVGDPTFNEVYLKAFLQSYAKAVGLSPSAVSAALSAQRAGSYDGSLHPDFEPGAARRTPSPSAPRDAPPPPADEAAAPESGESVPPSAPKPGAAPPAVQALRETPAPSERPRPTAPNPVPQARVNRPAVPTAKRSFDKNWTTILGLFGAFVVLLGLAFYFLIFRGDNVPETDAPTTVVDADGGETAIDSAGVGAGAAAGGPQLQLPIQVGLTAGGDGLQSFRVTEDAEDRRPYWIEVGTTEQFEADSVLILWGEDPSSDFSEATVEIQGMRFTPPSGRALRIDRQSGQRLLDSLATASTAAPATTE